MIVECTMFERERWIFIILFVFVSGRGGGGLVRPIWTGAPAGYVGCQLVECTVLGRECRVSSVE